MFSNPTKETDDANEESRRPADHQDAVDALDRRHETPSFGHNRIDDNQVKALVPQLEAVFKTKLETSVSVDSTLIGGIKVIVGDQMLDASVRGKLDAMATALNN